MAVTEIEVNVSPSGEVTARRDDGAVGPAGSIGFDGVDAELIRVFERWLRERGRDWRPAEIRAFGSLLHRTLFSPQLWSWVEQRLDSIGPQDRLRLQLAFPDDGLGHLATVPWEYLHVPNRRGREGFYLATDRRCMLTRYIPMERGRTSTAPAPRVRVLVLVAQPDDPALGEVIAEPVLELLDRLAGDLPLELTVHRQPTRESMATAVEQVRPDLVHFIGHGVYDEETEQGRIALLAETGRADWVGESVLSQLLAGADDLPRLVVLHSCAGGQTDYAASFAGIAPRLIRRGVQCVVAMQYAVTNRTAIAFSKGFYTGLAAGLPLDEAVQSGRRSLGVLYETDARLPGIPVIYLYSRDAVLLPPRPSPEG